MAVTVAWCASVHPGTSPLLVSCMLVHPHRSFSLPRPRIRGRGASLPPWSGVCFFEPQQFHCRTSPASPRCRCPPPMCSPPTPHGPTQTQVLCHLLPSPRGRGARGGLERCALIAADVPAPAAPHPPPPLRPAVPRAPPLRGRHCVHIVPHPKLHPVHCVRAATRRRPPARGGCRTRRSPDSMCTLPYLPPLVDITA